MRSRGTRPIVGLLVAAVALAVFTLAPVSAHFTQNTAHLGNHAWKQVIKKKADKRYPHHVKTIVKTFSIDNSADAANTTESASCPSGHIAIAGGVDTHPSGQSFVWLQSSNPMFGADDTYERLDGKNPAPNGWEVTYHNTANVVYTARLAVVCAKLG